MGKFVVKTAANGQFHFVLNAANGQVIGQSEMYKQKDSAMNGIESVRNNSAREGAFETKTAANGKFHWVLKATNGETVLQSQMYATEETANIGIESVKANAPSAEVDDQTA